MGFASTVCFPVVTIVDEEVGDVAEDFEQDSVVERHGGGDDGEMIDSGNERVVLCGVLQWCVCVGFCGIWQLVSVFSFFCSLFSCAR